MFWFWPPPFPVGGFKLPIPPAAKFIAFGFNFSLYIPPPVGGLPAARCI